VAVRSKVRICGRSLAEITDSNPAVGMIFVSFECCGLSGRDLCDGPITRVEESNRMLCVYLTVISKPQRQGGLGALGLQSHEKKVLEIYEIN
jgi:hypothetical protein